MPDRLRFVLPLLLLLGLLSWGAAGLVHGTGRRWFQQDVELRAELAVRGARAGLVRAWNEGRSDGVERILTEITHDERIMAAAACSTVGTMVARTPDYPGAYSCERAAPVLRGVRWREDGAVGGDPVHVSAVRVDDGDHALGFVVLVHDMSYADERAAVTRNFTLIAFAVLALIASLVTVLVARTTWRSWTSEIRRALRGKSHRPEFLPLTADVRALLSRIESDVEPGATGQAWTAQRLKQTLQRHLQGERVVIVANREPYIHERGDDGAVRVLHPASGLVTALEPVMRACSGIWVAHGSGSADRDSVDRNQRVWVPPDEPAYQIRRVFLSRAEEKGYYYGFSNEGLWPLCHVAHQRPVFRTADWEHYQRVNRKFAEAACAEADGDDPIILVQDYHFALAPRMIRERLPRATILSFWHIPWPNAERFAICPWGRELLDGMLGASIVGFHTQFHCNNFLETIERSLEARIDREQIGVIQNGRTTLVRPYPISIEWPGRWALAAAPVAECRASVIAELGLAEDTLLGVGVDRLDYTKGIEERVLAVEQLLERWPRYRGRFTFVQLAAPSRTEIGLYRELHARVEALVERVNARWSAGTYRPFILLRAHHEPPTVFRYYRAADLCYVSSLHDGMNLVAKEFVAARDDERGVLLLSRFTGAARELTEALMVNPYDLTQASAALATALEMSPVEQRERMRAMRSLLSHFNVYRWAGRMLIDAAQLRQHDRVTGRLEQAALLEGTG